MSELKNIKPQIFFIYAAVFFAIVFNIVMPPLQVPDELNHFYKSYQIAEGQFLPNKIDNRLGGEIPNSINEFVFPFDNAATEELITLTRQDIFNGFKIKYVEKDTARFRDFPNTSYYSPISYLPQAAAIFITKKLGCSIGTMYYAGRILTFLVWLVCMFFVIKIVPIYKWLFTLLCLLPMNLYITNSYSADTVSNILSFLFIAVVLKHTFSENKFYWKNLIPLLVFIALLALAKVVYVALVLSFLIIPTTKFENKKQYFLFSGILFFVAFAVASYWSGVVMSHYTPYVDYNPAYREWICLTHHSNYYQQKAYILSHGTYFLKVIYRSIFNHPSTFLDGYIGRFGNNDIYLPKWILWISYMVIFFIALFEQNKFKLTVVQKTILLGASFSSFVLLLLSQHLTWDNVGEGVVDLIQGRYLIPLFPFLFLLMGGYKLKFNINYGLILIGFLMPLYTFSAYKIAKRYYIGKCIEEKQFTCNIETVNEKEQLLTSDKSIFLPEGNLKTDSVSHAGKSSLLLSEQSPFGLTYRFNNLNEGDLLEATLWQKGKGAVLVLESDATICEKIYAPSNDIFYYDKKDWGILRLKFLMTKNCRNTKFTFYVWNPTKTKIYVDDLKFSIKKFAK